MTGHHLANLTGIELRALAAVRRKARALERAERELETELVRAQRSGCSYRAIAEAAGRNHETVRTIIRRHS